MNIYTVRDNLKNTIAGKEKMLAGLKSTLDTNDVAERMVLNATRGFLEINIGELKRILQDVEQCCEKATQDSWALNPDRSGGQFAHDEIYNMGRDGWIEP
jgi:hypothetical protein